MSGRTPLFMLTDDEITGLQLALENSDLEAVTDLLKDQSGADLTGLQLFADHTLLMYACEKSTPEIVTLLLERGTQLEELEWSTNNELKSTLRNEEHRNKILPLILKAIPEEIRTDMIETDWDPDDMDQGAAKSPLEMAEELKDRTCYELLKSSR